MQRTAAHALIVIALFASGCVTNPAAPPPQEDPAGPTAWRYACPGQPTVANCTSSLREQGTRFAEPFLAMHPVDPATFAVAVNERPTTPIVAGAEPIQLGMRVFVSRDEGKSWASYPVPFPPASSAAPVVRILSDPTMAFDDNGAVHFVGLSVDRRADILPPGRDAPPALQGTPGQIFYARLTNGAWSSPVLVAPGDGDQDRPWLMRAIDGRLVLTWQAVKGEGTITDVAQSTDEGVTWVNLPPEEELPCQSTGPLATSGPDLILTCTRYSDTPQVQLWSVGRGEPSLLSAVAAPAGNVRHFALIASNGTAFLIVEQFSGGTDRGQTQAEILTSSDLSHWQPGQNLADIAAIAPFAFVTWATLDPKDRLHLLVRATQPNPAGTYAYTLHHLVLDNRLDVLEDHVLDTWMDEAAANDFTVVPDHDFEAIAAGPDGSLHMAWSHATLGRANTDGVIRMATADPPKGPGPVLSK